MRGRSLVPVTFFRTRQWRSCWRRCFFCVCMFLEPRIWPGRLNQLLLNGLAFFALDVFARITHTLALVRLRRVVGADFGSHFADQHLIRTFDGQFGVFFHRDLDLIRNGVVDRVRETEAQVHDLAGDGSLETDALNLKLLDEAVRDALDHVIDERAAQTMQRLSLRIFTSAADDDLVAFDLQAGALRQFPVELALRAFDVNFLPFDLDLDFGRDGNRLFSNTRHKIRSLPDVAEQFSADVLLAGFLAGHHTFGGGNHCHTEATAHAGDFGRTDIITQTRRADALDPFDDALLAFIFQAQLNSLLGGLAFDDHFRHITLGLEDLREAFLHLGMRDRHRRQQRAGRIADAGQHVCNRINHIKLSIQIVLTSSLSRRRESNHSTPLHGTSNASKRTCAYNHGA